MQISLWELVADRLNRGRIFNRVKAVEVENLLIDFFDGANPKPVRGFDAHTAIMIAKAICAGASIVCPYIEKLPD